MRFTIRDLLWLTVVVALAVGWWVRERKLQTELERLDRIVTLQTAVARAAEQSNANLRQVLKSNGWTINDVRRPLALPPNLTAPAPKLPSD
jgi:hypothetical protein